MSAQQRKTPAAEIRDIVGDMNRARARIHGNDDTPRPATSKELGMQLSRLRSVFEQDEPAATVYLEGRAPAEDAAQQVRLRWQTLRDRLASDGADEQALDAIDDVLFGERAGEVQADGRVLVATASGIALDAPWDAALGAGDAAWWTPDPQLGAYVREESRSVRMLVAIADQHGATVRWEVTAPQHTLSEQAETTAEPVSSHGVHKPRGGALSHNQIQRRADEAVQQNARGVADHLQAAAAAFGPHLVVIAGEVQARSAIRDELSGELSELSVEAERGGTDDAGAEQALADELREIADRYSTDRAAERSDQFHQARAHDLAVEGAEQVAAAAEVGAVETLLLNYDRNAVDEATLLRACVITDADADLTDQDLTDGIGAILRFAFSPG